MLKSGESEVCSIRCTSIFTPIKTFRSPSWPERARKSKTSHKKAGTYGAFSLQRHSTRMCVSMHAAAQSAHEAYCRWQKVWSPVCECVSCCVHVCVCEGQTVPTQPHVGGNSSANSWKKKKKRIVPNYPATDACSLPVPLLYFTALRRDSLCRPRYFRRGRETRLGLVRLQIGYGRQSRWILACLNKKVLLVLATPTSVRRAQTVPLESSSKEKGCRRNYHPEWVFLQKHTKGLVNLKLSCLTCGFILEDATVFSFGFPSSLRSTEFVLLLHKAAIYCWNTVVSVMRAPSHMVHCLILAGNCSDVSVSSLMSHADRKHFPGDKYVFLKSAVIRDHNYKPRVKRSARGERWRRDTDGRGSGFAWGRRSRGLRCLVS